MDVIKCPWYCAYDAKIRNTFWKLQKKRNISEQYINIKTDISTILTRYITGP